MSKKSLRLGLLAFVLLATPFIKAQDVWDSRAGLLTGSSTSPSQAIYAGGRFLLSGTGFVFWHSAAGTAAWSVDSLPSPPNFFNTTGIATDGNTVVVAGTNNTIYTTTAGSISGFPATPIAWTQRNPAIRPTGRPNFGRVRFLNNQFILTVAPFNDTANSSNSYTELLTSSDGANWTSKKFLAATTGNLPFTARDIAFKPGATAGSGTYVITTTSSDTILTAPENLSGLTRVTLNGLSSSGQNVIFANGRFILITQNGKLFTSATGALNSWTQSALPVSTATLNDVFYDGTTFVLVGNTVSGSNPVRPTILKSTDGVTWSEASTIPATGTFLSTVTKGDGLWLAAGNTRTLVTSGSSSVGPPVIAPLSHVTGNTGGAITISANITSSPPPTSIEWLKDGAPISNGSSAGGSIVSGAGTAALTISGLTLSDTGSYSVRVTNSVAATTSTTSNLIVSAAANGAVLTPYGLANTLGGEVIPGSAPAKTVVGMNSLATFTAAGGISLLPNVPANYSYYGAINSSRTKVLLGNPNSLAPLLVYDLPAQAGTLLPAISFPLGPVNSANSVLPSAIAENGNVGGVIRDTANNLFAFHYTAATQTYTVLGNVPNAGNDIATSIGGISADGTTLSGYERIGFFNGPFLWKTSGGFTLLPDPENGSAANGDIRAISPSGRFTVGFGAASPAFGGGQTAMRWDRSPALTAPVGFALTKTFADTFADARCVLDDGTAGGTVRRGFSFTTERAAIWLPNGALIVLPEYLASRYGLAPTGFILNQVTSLSPDRRVVSGSGTNAAGQAEGWLLVLPEPIDLAEAAPDIAVRAQNVTTSGSTLTFGSLQVGSGVSQTYNSYIANIGSADLSVSAATITGTNAADFSLALSPPYSAVPGTYGINRLVAFGLRFTPQPGPEGARNAVITISSNDPDAPAFTVNLVGTASAPPASSAAEVALADYLAAANVPANLRGALDDPDHDGIENLLEFALGLPPMASSPLPVAVNRAGVLSLTYRRAQLAHVIYTVTSSTDFGISSLWSATGVDQGSPDGNGVTTARVPITTAPRFLRIEVRLAGGS